MDEIYFLRHYLSSLRYRCSKAILNAPSNYPNYELGNGVRTPIEILAHMSDVIRYAQSVFDNQVQLKKESGNWNDEVQTFFNELHNLDNLMKSNGIPNKDRIIEKLIQGPLSDAMTHVGQLSMIRRMAGYSIPGENFFIAEVKVE
ncbi:hypothetical protein MKY98_17760 [Paenibacillus sp. FSL M8-0228]|uniref:hypothetical protein n=1 Tax=Paenibacillus TaxID=44249 RepID=UPI00083D5A9D|nr:hypothetical protein [Paenibacillus polymyxa]MBO3286227.1 hypothetical protein [Paenibacillus polymyxa]ODB58098.1 hypothetical protein A7311_13200 [Paenibacillus polymyxa]